jgi:3-oxoacyl-[acyl-carrier protein] reductase
MADRYQTLAGTPAGRVLVKNLRLPDPVPLRRYEAGRPLLDGSVLVGGAGRLREQAVGVIAAYGAEPLTALPREERVHGLVFDATAIEDTSGLLALQEFFTPVLRRLEDCSRIVVLGTRPEMCATPSARVAHRALEGFTRSLGKEVKRGGTVQLVYVAPGAEGRMASTLTFLLSPKSAYVSGQVVRVGLDLPEPEGAPPPALRPLSGKVALVTGAARGIGEAIARTLHRDGATIVGLDVAQSASDLGALMDELDGESLILDVTSVDAPQRVARALEETHGGVDVVVHNAGITRDKKLVNMSADRWSSVIAVNVAAPERITAELADRSLVRPNGRIVGLASIAGIAGNAGQTNYAASKAGVIGLVDALTPCLADQQVTINAVAPGFIETQMTARVPLVLREAGRRMNAMSQGGLPVDVAETVAWFAHPGSYGVTGNVVRVCGQSWLGA